MIPPPIHEAGHVRIKRCRHGVMAYDHHDTHIGRSLDLYGEYCEAEVDLFRQLVRPGQIVVDAGANIGAHTVFLSKHVGPTGRVLAFEPQRLVFHLLCTNLALGAITNVDAHHAALGAQPGTIVVPELDVQAANNFGSLGLGDGAAGAPAAGASVPVLTLDGLAAQGSLPACHFIKIDVEGMELDVLTGAASVVERFRPRLYVEADRRDKSPALIAWLLARGYRCHWHFSPFFRPTNHFGNADNAFGPLVCLNMLCLPPDDGAQLDGFRAVKTPDDWPFADR